MKSFDIEELKNVIKDRNLTKEQLIATISNIKFNGQVFENNKFNEEKNAIQLPNRNRNIKKLKSHKSVEDSNELERKTKIKDNMFIISELDTSNIMGSLLNKEASIPIIGCSLHSHKSNYTDNFLNRTKMYTTINKERKEDNMIKYIQKETAECTFHPKVNDQEVINTSKEVSKRLYNDYEWKKIVKKQKMEERKLEVIKDEINHPFHPQINSNHVKPRYMVANKESINPTTRSNSINYKEFTFTPQVNKCHKICGHFKDYLSKNTYSRLNSAKKKTSVLEVTHAKKPLISKERLNKFLNRQNEFQKKRNEKRANLYMSIQIDHNPCINKKSEELLLAKHHNKKRTNRQTNSVIANKCNSPQKTSGQSKLIERNNIGKLGNSFVTMKNKKNNKVNKAAVKECNSEFTFKPKINSTKSTNEKIDLRTEEDIYEYIKKMKPTENTIRILDKMHNSIKEYNELYESIYNSKINDTTGYEKNNIMTERIVAKPTCYK